MNSRENTSNFRERNENQELFNPNNQTKYLMEAVSINLGEYSLAFFLLAAPLLPSFFFLVFHALFFISVLPKNLSSPFLLSILYL